MWGVRGRALSLVRQPILGLSGRGLLPTGCWCGGCGRGDPSPIPSVRSCQLALRALGAARGRLGGGGGASLALGPGVRGWAFSHAQPPVLGACSRGPLPTGCCCGGCGQGTRHQCQCALLRAGFALFVGGTRAPGGGRLLPGGGASGVWCSPTPDRPSLGRAAGAHYIQAVGAGGVGVGTPHQPHSARSCELVLRAVGAVRGRPGGGRLLPQVWGVRGWALSVARPPVLGACGRNPLRTSCGCGGGGGRGDPSPAPLCALLRAGFARCAGRRLRGGASCLGVRRSPTPDRPPLGRAAGAS